MFFFRDTDFTTDRIDTILKKKYDAIIIGGGTSGIISALTLIERGKTVALIEAGITWTKHS